MVQITPRAPNQCHIRGTWSLSARLPRDRNCASLARQLLTQRARADLSARELEDASLIVSELATNAFLHGRGDIVMNLTRGDLRLRVEVIDEGNPPWIDVVAQADRDISGRGLWLVSQLSSDWGVDGGARVWAELELGDAADEARRTPAPEA